MIDLLWWKHKFCVVDLWAAASAVQSAYQTNGIDIDIHGWQILCSCDWSRDEILTVPEIKKWNQSHSLTVSLIHISKPTCWGFFLRLSALALLSEVSIVVCTYFTLTVSAHGLCVIPHLRVNPSNPLFLPLLVVTFSCICPIFSLASLTSCEGKGSNVVYGSCDRTN